MKRIGQILPFFSLLPILIAIGIIGIGMAGCEPPLSVTATIENYSQYALRFHYVSSGSVGKAYSVEPNETVTVSEWQGTGNLDDVDDCCACLRQWGTVQVMDSVPHTFKKNITSEDDWAREEVVSEKRSQGGEITCIFKVMPGDVN